MIKASGKAAITNNDSKWITIALMVLLLLTALMFSRSFFFDFLAWDDDRYIKENPFIRDFSIRGIYNIFTNFYFANYHPLTSLTFLFEYKLYGLNALPYHIFNVVLHLLNTFLVFVFVYRLSTYKMVALIVATFFALHPMHVESVVWVSERKDVLYTFFYFLSLLVYLRYLETSFKAKYYALLLVTFLCSLMSKSAAVTLPVLLLAIDLYKGRTINYRLILEKIPLFILSLIFGIVAIIAQQKESAISPVFEQYSVIERLLVHSYSIVFYFIKLIFPFHLSAIHYYPAPGHLSWIYYISPLLLLIIFSIVFILKKNIRKEYLFSLAFFFISISVMLQFVPVGHTVVAERYSYVPYAGLFYFIAISVQKIVGMKLKRWILSLLGLYSVMIVFVTHQRIEVWKNDDVFFNDVIKKYPDNFNTYYFRGRAKKIKGDVQEAMRDFNKCLSLMPNYVPCLADRADIFNMQGKPLEALHDLKKAMQFDSTTAELFMGRGLSYSLLGDYPQALNDYNQAIKLKPYFAQAYINRGIVFINLDKPVEALQDFDKAIKIMPDLYMAYNNKGMALHRLKRYNEAIENFNRALKMKPDYAYAYNNRGKSKFMLHDIQGALNDYNTSLRLDNTNAYAYMNRAELYHQMKNFENALNDINIALKINSALAEAYFIKAQICFDTGQMPDACFYLKKAIELGYKVSEDKLRNFNFCL